jgi:manganese/iron transport system permease protein/iron/zinc/copper transport system permease protein
MSYIGHGMSHAIFGGAVVGFLMKVNFYLFAGAWGFISAMMINRIARRRVIGADAAIGVITTASFAIGIALVSTRGKFERNFDAALFGEALGVTTTDVLIVAGVALAVAAVVFAFYRRLLFITFDPEVAEASGVNTGRIDTLFSLVLASTIVATMNVMGVTLIAAALVVPPAMARMLTDSFSRMLWISIVVGAISGFVGMYLSWFLDIPSGPSIVLVGAGLFLIAYVANGARGARRLRGAGAHI